ncbi:MAG: NYN domain-containing protein [Thermodesulfovibrionales bacterium]|nr:NYN domain-containing protein [Thermodesulfovibrionales bacterium]
MYLIIDGYNLIGIFHKNMEKARSELIDKLISYKKIKKHEITVVFDAYKHGNILENSSFRGGIRIVYTRVGETADEAIKRMLNDTKRQWVVITSDKLVAKYVWSVHSIPIESEVFLEILEETLQKNEQIIEESTDKDFISKKYYEYSKGLKGNPYKPSKKNKAINRVLNKL